MNAISNVHYLRGATALSTVAAYAHTIANQAAFADLSDEDREGIAFEIADKIERRGVDTSIFAEEKEPMLHYAGECLVNREALADAFAVAKLITDKRSTIAILENAKLAACADGMLAVTVTDLDIEAQIEIPAAVDPLFAMTVPTHLVEKFLKSAPKSEMIAITSRGERYVKRPGKAGEMEWQSEAKATLDFERARYDVVALPVHDFPVLTPGEVTHMFDLPGKRLRDTFEAVRGAISTEETRYYLNGIYMHVDEAAEILTAVTTDGHRLYRQTGETVDGMAGMPGMILPRGLIDLMMKLTAKRCPDIISIAVSGLKIRLKFGAITITSKLIDGTFPDYGRVIPAYNDLYARFDADALQLALKAAAAVHTKGNRAVKLTAIPGEIKMTANDQETGRGESYLPCILSKDGEDNPSIEIGFAASYLAEMVAQASPGGGKIVAQFNDAMSPTVFTGTREGWLGVLMPMRV